MAMARKGLRHRTSSFFDLDEYSLTRHENKDTKGKFLITHCETPENTLLEEDYELKLFPREPRRKQRQHTQQNTFQLDPTHTFNTAHVVSILRDELGFLENVQYEADIARQLTVELGNKIKAKVKHLFPRYKFIVQLTLGEKRNQGIKVASKCFWDTERDNFATETVTSSTLFAVATVYGLYYE